jgi:hypothetical protein
MWDILLALENLGEKFTIVGGSFGVVGTTWSSSSSSSSSLSTLLLPSIDMSIEVVGRPCNGGRCVGVLLLWGSPSVPVLCGCNTVRCASLGEDLVDLAELTEPLHSAALSGPAT